MPPDPLTISALLARRRTRDCIGSLWLELFAAGADVDRTLGSARCAQAALIAAVTTARVVAPHHRACTVLHHLASAFPPLRLGEAPIGALFIRNVALPQCLATPAKIRPTSV